MSVNIEMIKNNKNKYQIVASSRNLKTDKVVTNILMNYEFPFERKDWEDQNDWYEKDQVERLRTDWQQLFVQNGLEVSFSIRELD